MNTPAVTMVAAWISAETGVGPSIASGSQVCSGNCADLPMAPMNSSRQSAVSDVATGSRGTCIGLPAMPGAASRNTSSKLIDAEHAEEAEDAEREAEVADAVDDEGLDGGGVGRRARVPEADQQVGGEADAFPAEEQLQEVVARHQHQHGEGEQREIGEEARAAVVVVHVADGVDVDERDTVVTTTSITAVSVSIAQRPRHVELAGGDPAQSGTLIAEARAVLAGRHMREADLHERRPTTGRRAIIRNSVVISSDGAVADDAAEQAGDQRASERQEDDGCVESSERLLPLCH